MLGPETQEELLRRLAEAAERHGLRVAPVGSVFFLHRGRPAALTKDLDSVVHDVDGEPASLEDVLALGRAMGKAEAGHDKATVTVHVSGLAEAPVVVDLIRGKEGAKRGFFPRSLLREAASRGTVEGSVVWYPIEYVLVLKADAAVDRRRRADAGGPFADANRKRARVFQEDVQHQVQAAFEEGMLRTDYLLEALGHLKAARRTEAARLLEFAAAGRLSLE